MDHGFKRERISDTIHFSHITDTKFKSNRISVCLITKLSPEKAAVNAVVPNILRLGCKSCPDFTALNRRLGRLYGARLYGDVTKYADKQILVVSIKGLDSRVTIHGEDMVRELSSLLCDIVLDPVIENGAFPEGATALERQNLIDTIESEINDKRVFARARCLELLFGGAPQAVRPYGDVEHAKAITPRSAYEAYCGLLKNARIELLFAGSGDPAAAKETLCARFAALDRPQAAPLGQPESAPAAGGIAQQTEPMDVSQSKLVMGFWCGDTDEQERYALRLMSAMYGGTPSSKLFLNVREKLSLCYYCASRYDKGNNILLVDSGVQAEKKEAAQAEILRQLEAIQNGEFTDEELQNTKLAMNTGFAATTDSLAGIESWYLTQILSGGENAPAYEQAKIAAVTRGQVVAAAKKVTLGAVYFLKENGEHKEESKQ
ncbi:EF-P 5-aminopentanol modification-associated protein YfmF [Harryflintia acetispora]|uniref:Zn-dependent peptidase n=1 Tax=Harryflintia acetispora TaxID=1849041 RepID=A0A9X8UJ87_9FIRM|nr:insulinase family protein [Harryflintia acetispora]TCL43556.1 putative Zn-dependent peptidase [Harryflintia acetispora]